jgi:hypothetical protein
VTCGKLLSATFLVEGDYSVRSFFPVNKRPASFLSKDRASPLIVP